MSARIKDLERRYSTHYVIEFAGLAEVVKDPDGNARKKVELAGMARGARIPKWAQISLITDISYNFMGFRSIDVVLIMS